MELVSELSLNVGQAWRPCNIQGKGKIHLDQRISQGYIRKSLSCYRLTEEKTLSDTKVYIFLKVLLQMVHFFFLNDSYSLCVCSVIEWKQTQFSARISITGGDGYVSWPANKIYLEPVCMVGGSFCTSYYASV